MANEIDGSSILVVYSSVNVKGRKDATGAFIPMAKKFAKTHNVPAENMLGIDCINQGNPKRFKELCSFLDDHAGNIKVVAFFCHGWSSGIQFGCKKTKDNTLIDELVSKFAWACTRDVKVVLYACSTASTSKDNRKVTAPGTDGGFADTLRDTMRKAGFRGGWVDAHLTPGHTVYNPFVCRFYTSSYDPTTKDKMDLPGGEYIVAPGSKLFRDWRKLLKTDFGLKFPLIGEEEIYATLLSK